MIKDFYHSAERKARENKKAHWMGLTELNDFH
jgi:hypothetical protein